MVAMPSAVKIAAGVGEHSTGGGAGEDDWLSVLLLERRVLMFPSDIH